MQGENDYDGRQDADGQEKRENLYNHTAGRRKCGL
jgi:hypothetical protein